MPQLLAYLLQTGLLFTFVRMIIYIHYRVFDTISCKARKFWRFSHK